MLLLVLARAQEQPIEVDGGRDATYLGDGRREWLLPGMVGCGFESLEQLESRFGQTAHDALRGVRGGVRLLDLARGPSGRLGSRLAQRLANRGKNPMCFVEGDV